ncbi:MAG: anaerobic ribonucleoside-triphosphate reductase [Atopobiaceae bacterium]|jgi:anaerobic ribonucleoside-triphosphate reductase|nr:anaerobic ribonucleoside-triphosphate reductase [Atopobiaceae bacterium]
MVNRNELTSTGTIVDGVELSNEERQPCEVWTRVMGYYRPVAFYNTGKKGEFHERVEFVEPGACPCSREQVA